MPETAVNETEKRQRTIRYRGRRAQILIYLGKFLRMFLYQNDWKVFPMAAVIAGLVAMVIRTMYFRTMEGTLMGAFALSCVAIWNGCFNSIQVICRERDVIKREHRSGMHVSSYIIAHLIYQAMLCLVQTGITLYVCWLVKVEFPSEGLFTRWLIVDIGITMFLISFASDTLSLWISSLSRNTTTAMTIMPFVLIFQLVFSGAMLSLPAWSEPLSDLTISRYGLTALAAQADYNNRPLVTLWNSVIRLRDSEITATVTVGQVMDYLSDDSNPGVEELRRTEITRQMTVRDLAGMMESGGTSGEAAEIITNPAFLDAWGDKVIQVDYTLGDAVDSAAANPELAGERDREITLYSTLGEILDIVGEEKAHWTVQQMATDANYDPAYENTELNIASCWASLILITLVCSALATITLEFIDKDKR